MQPFPWHGSQCFLQAICPTTCPRSRARCRIVCNRVRKITITVIPHKVLGIWERNRSEFGNEFWNFPRFQSFSTYYRYLAGNAREQSTVFASASNGPIIYLSSSSTDTPVTRAHVLMRNPREKAMHSSARGRSTLLWRHARGRNSPLCSRAPGPRPHVPGPAVARMREGVKALSPSPPPLDPSSMPSSCRLRRPRRRAVSGTGTRVTSEKWGVHIYDQYAEYGQ